MKPIDKLVDSIVQYELETGELISKISVFNRYYDYCDENEKIFKPIIKIETESK